jgi:cytoskeleton protein RodZ
MKEQQDLIPLAVNEYLKQQRLARKLTLRTVAKAISLDEKILEDIEEDRPGHIAAVYRTGYIRSYARFLDIPEDEISQLIDSAKVDEPELRTIFSEPPKRNPIDNWLRATSYVLASLLIGTLAWQFTHEAVRLSQNGSRMQSGQELLRSNNDQPAQETRISEPVNASIASLDNLSNKRASRPEAGEKAWAAVSNVAVPEGHSRLRVQVSADSWVEISDGDGAELEMDLLRGGSEKTYQGKPPFRILFGRASAVSLSVDGEQIDLEPFAKEDVVQMNWPQQFQADSGNAVDN